MRQYHYQQEDEETIFGERGRKCSLDGERNVKFYRSHLKERTKIKEIYQEKLCLA